MQKVLLIMEILLKPQAYLDPGTGSLLIQIILAGLLGIGVAIRIFWDKIVGLFNNNKKNKQDIHDPTAVDDELDE